MKSGKPGDGPAEHSASPVADRRPQTQRGFVLSDRMIDAATGTTVRTGRARSRGDRPAVCPLYLRERPNIGAAAKRRAVPEAAVSTRSKNPRLFDHLVGVGEQCRRDFEAKGPCRL